MPLDVHVRYSSPLSLVMCLGHFLLLPLPTIQLIVHLDVLPGFVAQPVTSPRSFLAPLNSRAVIISTK